jgi:hypothetical protein
MGGYFMKRVRLGLLLLVFLTIISLTAGAGGQASLIRGIAGEDSVEGIHESGWRVSKGDDVAEIAKITGWGRPETLMDHYRRHGADFKAKSAREYAQKASDFFAKAQEEKFPTKIAPDGTIRIFDRKTNTFGAYNPDGTTKTFFKPKNGPSYWNRQ